VLALRGDSIWVAAEGLAHPEGICALPSGSLLVTEDVMDGRLLRLDPAGGMEVLAEGLSGPEGVCRLRSGAAAVSWSNAQSGGVPFPLRSGVRTYPGGGGLFDRSTVYSLSDLVCDSSGVLYAAVESSGLLTWHSILALHPDSADARPFCRGLFSAEGLCTTQGGFPLYAVEENRGGFGRVVAVEADGSLRVVADSLPSAEDVVVLPDGSLAVSVDGTGQVLRIPLTE
jgi:sugar lactone lactonase YvrE